MKALLSFSLFLLVSAAAPGDAAETPAVPSIPAPVAVPHPAPAQAQSAPAVVAMRVVLKGGDIYYSAARQAAERQGLQVFDFGKVGGIAGIGANHAFQIIGPMAQIQHWKETITNMWFLDPWHMGSIESMELMSLPAGL